MSYAEARREIERNKAAHFDPEVVDAFLPLTRRVARSGHWFAIAKSPAVQDCGESRVTDPQRLGDRGEPNRVRHEIRR